MALFTSSPLKKHKSVLFLLENESAFLARKKSGFERWKKVGLFTFQDGDLANTWGTPNQALFRFLKLKHA